MNEFKKVLEIIKTVCTALAAALGAWLASA